MVGWSPEFPSGEVRPLRYLCITNVDERKFFVTASMTAADGTLLSEANGLMVRLLPHQP
jgi:hypothetical protein